MPDLLFKVVIFGDAGVGKTTLVNRYLTGLFNAEYKITVGVDFHVKNLQIEGKKVTLQIWDFAGETQFRFLLPTYVKGASGGIFMFDVARPSSLQHIVDWMEIINIHVQKYKKELPIIMVGGKIDLEKNREITKEEAHKIAKAKNLIDCIECSAKTGKNVEDIFISIARKMMEKAGLI